DDALNNCALVLRLAAVTNDSLLRSLGLVTQAQLLQRLGKTNECAKTLGLVMDSVGEQAPEVTARYEAVVATELASERRFLDARGHHARAQRICEAVANTPVLLDLVRLQKAADDSMIEIRIPDGAGRPDEHHAARRVAHGLGVAFLQASRPDIAANELVDVLVEAGCVDDAEVIEELR